MAGINNQNTQQPKKVPITISGYPQAVKDMVRTKYPDFDQVMDGGQQGAMNGAPNGNTPAVAPAPNMNFFQNNGAVGKFEAVNPNAQPQQNGTAAPTDFINMPKPAEFVPQGNGFANPTTGPTSLPYMKDAADTTPQNQTNFEGMQAGNGQGAQWNPLEQNSDVGYKNAPYDPSQYDSLSAALNGGGDAAVQPQQPQFQADPSQKDGGFANWVKKLIPKKRPGKREGETDDEYDARRTRNMEMVATFADAIRHMGNIVNTAKGAPLQQFNDPTSMLEQGYQNRKAQRQKQAALDADAAYKASNLSIKEAAAKANEAYKQMTLGYRDAADRRAQRQFEYQIAKDAAAAQRQAEQDKQKQSNWESQFKFRQQQAAISNGLRQQSINKRGSGKSGGGRGGSGAAYSLYNPNTGNTEYFKNNNEFLRRAGELGYDTSKPVSTTESSEVVSKDGIKKVSNTKRGTSVNAKIGQQEAQKKKQNANKNARKGSKLKNTSALGL